jgi:antitoxin component YwqK of YwqJK toxin-antitoxin module
MLFSLILAISMACQGDRNPTGTEKKGDSPSMVKRYRDNGTLSSVNPVDEDGFIDGVKVNYYEDGITIHSKVTYEHGRKHGPALWYYGSGQVYEHTNFLYGKKDGLTKRYYESGELMEEVTWEGGEELPGKKRYDRDGTLLSD